MVVVVKCEVVVGGSGREKWVVVVGGRLVFVKNVVAVGGCGRVLVIVVVVCG